MGFIEAGIDIPVKLFMGFHLPSEKVEEKSSRHNRHSYTGRAQYHHR
jgi:hypothetical protein